MSEQESWPRAAGDDVAGQTAEAGRSGRGSLEVIVGEARGVEYRGNAGRDRIGGVRAPAGDGAARRRIDGERVRSAIGDDTVNGGPLGGTGRIAPVEDATVVNSWVAPGTRG